MKNYEIGKIKHKNPQRKTYEVVKKNYCIKQKGSCTKKHTYCMKAYAHAHILPQASNNPLHSRFSL